MLMAVPDFLLCPTYQRAGARNGRFQGVVLSALVYEM
jgi:hypothetical protein